LIKRARERERDRVVEKEGARSGSVFQMGDIYYKKKKKGSGERWSLLRESPRTLCIRTKQYYLLLLGLL
jgi:hypothetical protein